MPDLSGSQGAAPVSLFDETSGNQLAIDSSGRITANRSWTLSSGTDSIAASQSGTWNIGTLSTITNVVHVDDNAGSLTVDGTITANIGTTNGLALDTTLAKLTLAQGSTTSGQTGALILGAVTTANPTYTTAQSSPLSLTTSGALRIDNTSWLGSTAPTVGSKTSINSIPVVIASDQAAVTTTPAHSTTGTTSSVASSATNVTLLAANTARKGATVHNESNQNLFLKLGTTSSTTSYTVRLISQAYYEVPFNYDGIITGTWAAANGNARVTELT